MLHIENLTATVAGQTVLRGLDLDIGAGEVHAIMSLTSTFKSLLSNT